MKDNKPWYEKIYIWIGIIAAICAILGISVFGNISFIEDDNADDTAVTLKDNEINTGNQSPIVIGDNNTFSFENSDSKDESNKLSISETEDFSVAASYNMNTPQTSMDGINVLVTAETSFPADHVKISGVSDDFELKPTDMHGCVYK